MPKTKGTRLSEVIRQRLADDILHGVYPPGARLDEQRLAERFEMSRTPVREALQQLISAGLVEVRPHRGAIVSLPTDAALAEMFEVMGEIESSCARLAAQRISPAERVKLETVHRATAEAMRANNREIYRQLNFDFHDVIYRASHNEFLASTALAIRQRIAPFRRAQFEIPERLSKSYGEHSAIVRAILNGDGDGAGMMARAHVSYVRAASHDYVHGLEAAGGVSKPPSRPNARPVVIAISDRR